MSHHLPCLTCGSDHPTKHCKPGISGLRIETHISDELIADDLKYHAQTEWVRLILSVAMTTYNEKPEAERGRYLKVVAGSLVRGIVDRAHEVVDSTPLPMKNSTMTCWDPGFCSMCGGATVHIGHSAHETHPTGPHHHP